MIRFGKRLAISLSLALLTTPTLATASTAVPRQTASDASPWLALSALSPAAAVGVEGSGVAAAQPATVAPVQTRSTIGTPPVPILVYWLGVVAVMVYIATHDGGHGGQPNSPA